MHGHHVSLHAKRDIGSACSMLEKRSIKKKEVFFSYMQYLFQQRVKFLDFPSLNFFKVS